MKVDHLKAAPCMTTGVLAGLRICISVALIVQTVWTAIESSHHDSSFQYVSQWNLLAITILFTTMAVIQVSHTRRLKTFTLSVK